MCELVAEGKKGVVDITKCPFEFASPEFINFHLKNLVSFIRDHPIEQIVYEEEVTFELSKEATWVLIEYAKTLGDIEGLLLKREVYGLQQDPNYNRRVELMKKFIRLAYMNPIDAVRLLEHYREPPPERSIFLKSQETFNVWKENIKQRIMKTKFYELVKQTGDVRAAFLSLVGLKSLFFVNLLALSLPPEAKKIPKPEAHYKLEYDYEVQIYEIEEKDIRIYHLYNPILDSLSPQLKLMLKELIDAQMKESFIHADFNILFSLKVNEYRQYFMEQALMRGIDITPRQALLMAREAASWVVGFGSPIENIILDREHITDIYIDSENSPIYLEHREFGIVHTLFRYNRELLDRAFKNMVFAERGKKFDENNPVVDVVVKRAMMRCHLQRPPATFGELQGALRLMSEEPFTYAQYLYFHSFTPFFAGFDDVLVSLGSSEAVLGLKGSGKTSFTAAKIAAIGPNRRIIPIQDIWEIPVRAYRKRGFHIGAAKVAPVDREGIPTKELDLVTMANMLLRMGDAAIIINEVRSRSTVQGIINLLNTQPGVFLLYNLHAESLEDIRDRLELVFGIPAASMFATDRYTFLKKIRFKRKGKLYRVLGYEYESDRKARKFVKTFDFHRGKNIETSRIECLFLKNPEASSWKLDNLDLAKLEKDLDIVFVPPTIQRRSEDTGLKPEDIILQMFYKAKTTWDIYHAAMKVGIKELVHLDFYLKANNLANRIIYRLEQEGGEVDFKEAQKLWNQEFPKLLRKELVLMKKVA